MAALVAGLLTSLDAESGPVFGLMSVLAGLGAFVLFIWDAFEADLRKAGMRRRLWYVAGLIVIVTILVAAGRATQSATPLYRLGGSQDVAILGFLAPTADEQQVFDDVAASLTERLSDTTEGDVHNYTDDVKDPPLREFDIASREHLDSWVASFLGEVEAELVVGGYAENLVGGQTSLQVLLYVSPKFVADASELAGWYPMDEVVVDRSLSSTRTRTDLLESVLAGVGSVTALLRGLDSFQSGHFDEAIAEFDAMIADDPPEAAGSLADVVLLFRGHAYEAKAMVMAQREERAHLLSLAGADYRAMSSSEFAPRARLSLATNEYLIVAESGCRPGSLGGDGLERVASELRDLALDGSDRLTQLRTRVNLAQVELCRLSAEVSRDDGTVDRIIGDLTTVDIPTEGAESELFQRIKAFAFSIAATRYAAAGDLNRAVDAIGEALKLDGRFERQALWQGLRSGWLLKQCNVRGAVDAQGESLHQLGAAIDLGILPRTEMEAYQAAFSADLANARSTCGSSREEYSGDD